jgi:hypothetical protein
MKLFGTMDALYVLDMDNMPGSRLSDGKILLKCRNVSTFRKLCDPLPFINWDKHSNEEKSSSNKTCLIMEQACHRITLFTKSHYTCLNVMFLHTTLSNYIDKYDDLFKCSKGSSVIMYGEKYIQTWLKLIESYFRLTVFSLPLKII